MSDAEVTIHAAFMATAASDPGRPFLVEPGRRRFTYAEVAERVEDQRRRYAAAGYRPGHRLALLLGNTPEFFFHYLALNALGVSIVPVNPDYRADETRYLMEHSEASGIVTAETEAPPPAGRPVGAAPDECALLYTSGTTGRPKGCIITNFYFLNGGAWYRDMGGRLAIEPRAEVFLNPLPLYHMNHLGITATCAILTANALALVERFSAARWWGQVREAEATIIHYLGLMPPVLMAQPASPADRDHRVRFGLGAGVEPSIHAAFEERFGFPLVEVWGMTETGRIYGDNHEPRQIETRAFGRPFGGFDAKVVDAEDQELPRGREGELLVRCAGPDPRHGFFFGYLKNEGATEEAWRGGWFHTGDVVRQMPDGMLVFVDRAKNIIRRSGENIAAAEVEAALLGHPAVAQVAVIRAPDALREEEVMACIVPKGVPGDAVLAEALVRFCLARLAYYKAPGWIVFRDALPVTGTQKVQKQQIFPGLDDPRKADGAFDLRGMKRRG